MLVIFPFEEAIYRAAGIPATYVGHPLAEVIPMQPDAAAARAALGLPDAGPVVAILPGSRMSELKYNSAPFLSAARLLSMREPAVRFLAPMAGRAQREYFESLLAGAGLSDLPLPNILAREFVVPELLQDAATPEAIADALWHQLNDENARLSLVRRFTDMHHVLLRDTARLSADAVLEMISNHERRL
jgi:lipid-A-disaccharide synthase